MNAPPSRGEHGLRRLGVAELAAAVRVAAGLDHATGRVDGVEAVLGVGGERARETARASRRRRRSLLVGSYWNTAQLVVAIELDVAVVRGGQAGDDAP